jgi:SAM-dependent methyltransferase
MLFETNNMNYINALKGQIRKFENRLFDWHLGIDCGPKHNSLPKDIHSIGYMASSYRSLRTLIKESLKVLNPIHDLNFYDVGCGLGRACFYAEHRAIFNTVIGIDFDENLIQRAKTFKKKRALPLV